MNAVRRPSASSSTTTQLNTSALPPVEEMAGMALSLPHGTFTEDTSRVWSAGTTGSIYIAGTILIVVAATSNRAALVLMALFGAMGAVLFFRQSVSAPSQFFREFVLANVRVSKEESADNAEPATGRLPFRFAAVLAIAVITSILSTVTVWAPVGALVLLTVLAARYSPFPPKTWAPFLSYSAPDPHAPGVWVPTSDRAPRPAEALLMARRFAGFFLWHALVPLVSLGIAAPLVAPASAALSRVLPGLLASLITVFALAFVAQVLSLHLSGWLFADAARGDERFRAAVQSVPIDTQGEAFTPEWRVAVSRVLSSTHEATADAQRVRERDHIILGIEPSRGFPLLVHRSIFQSHCHVLGATGAGKTSLALLPVLLQLMGIDERTRPKRDPAIVIIDLKGDPALFHAVRLHCARMKKRFQFFTPEPERATFYFDPFQGFAESSASVPQLAQLLLDSLNLNHGEGYGRSYYTRVARAALLEAITAKPRPASFEEVLRRVERLAKGDKNAFGDAQELIAVLKALSYYPQLVSGTSGTDPERTIRMSRVLSERSCAYFWLPAGRESASAREIGKLVLFNLHTALESFDGDQADAFLLVDEFQRLVGENLSVILEQARAKGLGVILANHTQDQLKTADFDLGSVLSGIVHSTLYFRSRDLQEMKDLSQLSGTDLESDPWWTTPEHDRRRPAPRPRLSVEDIQRVRDLPGGFVFHPSAGRGYTQYGGLAVPGRASHIMPVETYQRLERMRWPAEPRIDTNKKVPKAIDEGAKREVEEMSKQILAVFNEDAGASAPRRPAAKRKASAGSDKAPPEGA